MSQTRPDGTPNVGAAYEAVQKSGAEVVVPVKFDREFQWPQIARAEQFIRGQRQAQKKEKLKTIRNAHEAFNLEVQAVLTSIEEKLIEWY
jgi:hypothetical protein